MGTENTLIQILEKVLGVKDVKRQDRFLEIGGNSLNLIEVRREIEDKTGVTLPSRIFFDKSRSTVTSLSAEIDARREPADPLP